MKIKQFLIGLILVVVSQYTLSKGQTILVFGDSLSAAYNIPIEKGWVALLEYQLKTAFNPHNGEQIQFKVTNASISGETTSGGLRRFSAEMEKTNPDIVILELGGNDGLRGFNLATTRSNLSKMIDISKQNNASVILAGIHMPPNYGRTYTQLFDKIYLDLAKIEHVSLIPFILKGVATHQEFMQNDGLHPNEKAQPIISATVMEHLQQLTQNH